MKLSDFDYKLPQELIAQHPLKERDASRMLVLDKATGKISHKHFYDLPAYLHQNDKIVLNDTKVMNARLIGKRKGFAGKIELLVLRELTPGYFECLTKPAKKIKPGMRLEFSGNGLTVTAAVENKMDNVCVVNFNNGNPYEVFDKIGLVPLPPYIKRQPDKKDEDAYQTIYAKKIGAVAAPTAGLHFTDSIMQAINDRKSEAVFITLHVGYGTFEPVTKENIEDHKMHSEYFEISKEAADKINNVKQKNGKILAVGTTACRALEASSVEAASWPRKNNSPSGDGSYGLSAKHGQTGLFIYPGYNFRIVDMLLTNFHMPKTTLLMLVCAFGGYKNVINAYKEAIKQKYRFYSYGDCMLIK